MNRLLQLTSLLLFITCNVAPSKSSLKDVLANGCYWDRLDSKYSPVANMCFKFNSDGSCLYFDYVFYNRKKTDTITLYGEGDNILPKTWSTKGDTAFIGQGMYYPVIKFTEDSIYSKTPNESDTVIFTKNCNVVRRSSK